MSYLGFTVRDMIVANENHEVLALRICRKVLREKNIVILSHPDNYDSKGYLPWSKSCPRGEDVPVLLACFPSTASNVWYMKAQVAE